MTAYQNPIGIKDSPQFLETPDFGSTRFAHVL